MFDVNRFESVIIIGRQPGQVRPGWLVFNAPRPLACSQPYDQNTWQGDFIHGVFYAQVDPADPQVDRLLADNLGLDGWLVEWRPPEQHADQVRDYAGQLLAGRYSHMAGKLSLGDWDESYRQRQDQRIVGPLLEGEPL